MNSSHQPSSHSLTLLAVMMLVASGSILYMTAHYRAKERILFATHKTNAKVLAFKAYPHALALKIESDVQAPIAPAQTFTLTVNSAASSFDPATQYRWVVPAGIAIVGDANRPTITLRNADDQLNRQIHVEVFLMKGEGKQGATAHFETAGNENGETNFKRMSRTLSKQPQLEY